MKIRCTLVIRCRANETAHILGEVLAPDNRSVPEDQRLVQSLHGAVLNFRMEARSTSSLTTTVESLLSDSGLFQEVWLLSRGKQAAGRGAS